MGEVSCYLEEVCKKIELETGIKEEIENGFEVDWENGSLSGWEGVKYEGRVPEAEIISTTEKQPSLYCDACKKTCDDEVGLIHHKLGK